MLSVSRYVLNTAVLVAAVAGCSTTDQGPSGQPGASGSGMTPDGQPTSQGGSGDSTGSGGELTGGAGGSAVAGTGGAVTSGGMSGTDAGGDVSTGGVPGTGGMTGTGGSGGGEPAPGCGNAAAPKGARNLTIQVNGKARTYVLFVPNGYDPKKSIPLIFAWHSSGASGAESRKYYKLEPVTGDGAIIVYPDGLNGAWDLSANGVDMKFFDLLLESISKDYCVDQARVFSTGYSFGGMMSHSLACDRGTSCAHSRRWLGLSLMAPRAARRQFLHGSLTQAMTPQSALRRARLREISGSKPMAAARRRCRPPPARAWPTNVPRRQ